MHLPLLRAMPPVLRRSTEQATSWQRAPPAGCLPLSSSSVNQALWRQQHPSWLSCLFSVPEAMSPLFLTFWDGWALSMFPLLLKGPLFCALQDGEGGAVELALTSLLLTRASLSTCLLWPHRHMLPGRGRSCPSAKLVPSTPLHGGSIESTLQGNHHLWTGPGFLETLEFQCDFHCM